METQRAAIPAPPEWARAESWTPEQQKQELQRRMGIVMTFMSLDLKFSPRPSDVIVATPAKCGTTWVSHICHQLRMGGSDPDFDDQGKVVSLFGRKIEHPADPRIFITHMSCSKLPRGGRIITCFRDPKDMVLSAYRFFKSMIVLKGRVAPNLIYTYLLEDMGLVKNRYAEKLLYCWEHRHDPDMLLLFFDDLKEDHIGCVRRIAKFIGIDCSEEVISRVVHTTTHMASRLYQNYPMNRNVFIWNNHR